jgi:hypothetical protein
LPDSLQLALDAAARQAQPVGNLFIAMAFELVLGNGAQTIVIERPHQSLIFFYRDRQHFRRRGISEDFVEPRAPAIAVAWLEHRVATDAAAATLLFLQQALVVDHFADGDGGQQLPERLTIDHSAELAASGAVVQTTQNAQRDVLLVRHPPGCLTEACASQLDQLAIVPLP